MRKINAERESSFSFARASRIAAAAAIILLLGGVVTRRDDVAVAPQGIENHVNVTLQTTDSTDPWQSDELKPYQSMVAWESWVDSEKKQGDHS